MGCGASKLGPAVQENVIASGHGSDTARRKKNLNASHGHLLNVTEGTVDAMSKFRNFAIEVQQPWADLKAFIHDDVDNADEIELREAIDRLHARVIEQSQLDVELIRQQNLYIGTMNQVLHELKIYDEVHKTFEIAVTRERDAQRAVMHAEERKASEKAKGKPSYESQVAQFDMTISDKKAALTAALQVLQSAKAACEAQAIVLRKNKGALLRSGLADTHESFIKYYSSSLALLQKFSPVVDELRTAAASNPLPDTTSAVPSTTTPAAVPATTAASVPPTPVVAAAPVAMASSASIPVAAPVAAPAPAISGTPRASISLPAAASSPDEAGTGGSDDVQKSSVA